MKVRATTVTAFLTGIWVFIVMNASQWWLRTQAGTGTTTDKERFTTTFGLFLLIGVPCFVFVFGILDARPTLIFSKEGMKFAGTRFLRILCLLAGFAGCDLVYGLAIRLVGTHP